MIDQACEQFEGTTMTTFLPEWPIPLSEVQEQAIREAREQGRNERLSELIKSARHHKMTPAEVFEQRVSFVYGQLMSENEDAGVSMEAVRKRLIEQTGYPAEVIQAAREQGRREAIAEAAQLCDAWVNVDTSRMPLDRQTRDIEIAIVRSVGHIAAAIRALSASLPSAKG